ncbi:MAG: hypothetical protein GIKADHBN_03470 [Phycisphaerales bacterium]|nr:hypothetical protein [Phycisphaerales bacterium]
MPTPQTPVATLPAKLLTAAGPDGAVRALFQPTSSSGGHAEPASFSAQDLHPAGAFPRGGETGASLSGIPAFPGFVLAMGWIWVTGKKPAIKTKLVIGGSDGTTFFARSSETLDQFYFVGPPSSRVHLSLVQPSSSRAVVYIDSANRYAECAGTAIVSRPLDPANPADAEFLATMNRAQLAAQAAGLAE